MLHITITSPLIAAYIWTKIVSNNRLRIVFLFLTVIIMFVLEKIESNSVNKTSVVYKDNRVSYL